MSVDATFFETPQAFRSWLQAHGTANSELLVGFHKVDSGRASMTWPQSVDEALCFGWIDGVRRRIDDTSYSIRFTPRRADSIWSAVNIRRANELIANGRMQPPGLVAFERRSARKSGVYSYEQRDSAEFGADELATFAQHPAAFSWFEAQPPGYRRLMKFRVMSAKQATTRARRLGQLIEFCIAGKRML